MNIFYIRDKDGNLKPIPALKGEAGADGKDYVLTDADKVEIAGMAAELVDVPDSGGDADWRKIGTFTALDNINPWIIDADENGEPFACTEFRIIANVCFFQLSSNSSANRSFEFVGDNDQKYSIATTNLATGVMNLVKGDDVSSATASFKKPLVIDVNSHCGYLVATTLSEAPNTNEGVLLASAYRNRGLPHSANYFKAINIVLGYKTNLVMAGSTLEIWGR